MTMNISLTPRLEDIIRRKVASGLYNSASEVIQDALRLMKKQDHIRAVKLEQLREDIREVLGSGEATPWDLEEFKREVRAVKTAKPKNAGV